MLTSERKITPTRYSPSRSELVDHIKKVFPKQFYRNDFDVKMKKRWYIFEQNAAST